MRFDAAVIGSGPAGATVARLLAQAGWSVALIERAAFPRRKVCGEFISAATLPVLEACGVATEFCARAGPPVHTVAAYSGATMVQAPLPRGQLGWGRALGREHLDRLLRDAAISSGATLFQPAELTAIAPHAGQYALTLRRADTVDEFHARVVIAACGSWNTKGPFVITRNARPSDLFAFKAHWRDARLAAGVMPLLAFPGGYGGMVHTDGGRVSLSCCIRRDALGRVRESYAGRAGEAVLRHILANTEGVRRALQGATVEAAILATGPLRPGIRVCFEDGIFFAGNAAGEAHPIIAEGISMAIQSAWLLAQYLLADAAAAGPNYARAWKRQFATRLHAASLFASLAMNDHGRAAAAQLIRACPAILTWGAALSSKSIGLRRDAA
ncbi:MAG TPA: NAD(P)/FAD-dependent oxidoreductase [Steroidobacteraceae bacterium]|jgi:flavin-dependent dehydrogenase|nr:NAD(P)/FAD-dependent oxidoreductase [Steroidobacteraceae bacterium]